MRDKDQLAVWRERLEKTFEKFQSNRLQMDLLEEDGQDLDDTSLAGAEEGAKPVRRECYDSLVKLIDDFERNLRMIEKMRIDIEGWSILLAHMVCSRLDSSTLKQWENYNQSTEAPEYNNLNEFLRRHSTVLQSIAPGKSRTTDPSRSEPIRPQKSRFSSIHSVTSSAPRPCPFCKQSAHSPFKCEAFRNSPIQQRYELVKRKALCINCLSPDHQIKNCSSSACRVCGQKHHTMLHQQTNNRSPNLSQASKSASSSLISDQTQSQTQNNRNTTNVSNQTSSPTVPTDVQVPSTSSSLSHCSTSLVANVRQIPSTVLLQTALVKVFDPTGYFLWARVLLDPASQLNVVSERFVQRLTVRKVKDHHVIGGIGKATILSTHSIVARIQSHYTEFSADLKFQILEEITRELPNNAVDISEWVWPNDIVLADPKFHEPAYVDMIIGMEIYYDLLLEGLIRLGPGKPVLQQTTLGWVVSGRVGIQQSYQSTPSLVNVCSTEPLDDQLAKFWELESCQSSSIMSVEETVCEAHFAATTSRDATGRFVVVLPKKPSVMPLLGNSYEIAKRRFLSLERRLQANPLLRSAYAAFINEYRNLKHMQEVIESQILTSPSYYLPHLCVVRPDSLTTKLRVVFDAPCTTDTGISLNDALMVGPVVQEDLVSIILRFRMPRYAIISDVEKMYRQVLVHSSDQPLQRILWRNEPSEPIQIYELMTVNYGTSAAPYLATKCLQQLSKLGQSSHPTAAQVIANDFYMDDMISGTDTIEEGKILCTELLQLLQSAGFSLRKWSSNSQEILAHIPADRHDERTVLDLDTSPTVKTLGLKWEPASDMFGFQVPTWNEGTIITERIALSDAARLYDPLGLVGPVIVLAKVFMQELWRNQNSWDEPLED
ncbi:uncharacterized protein LOC131679577 [Topomyia yanbarensis]|uniref:uncharacterized protein LOC131679577 n=1 Tax=Topomyia yanbarensis TaxID=2498891 RepID=UPI00273B970F|nr:uncharacterized protein LOC131679577 [Topomyia yanbarensis]